MANERDTQRMPGQSAGQGAQGDMTGLDATQRESYTEEGETDTRSEELADRYEAGASAARPSRSDQGGQQVTGGRYGSESDANESAQSATHSPSSSSGAD